MTALLALAKIVVFLFQGAMKMPTMTIRNVPSNIYAFYREKAARNGRSMEAELRRMLEENAHKSIRTPKDIANGIHALFAEDDTADLVEAINTAPQQKISDPLSF